MDILKKCQRSMMFMMLAYISLPLIYGHFSAAPTLIKAFFTMLIWMAVLVFPFKLIKYNDFDKNANRLLIVLLLLSLLAVIRSIFNSDADMYAFGNKWITLFFNEYTTLLLLPPLFIYLSSIPQTMIFAKKNTWILMLVGMLSLFTLNICIGFLTVFLAVFYEYANKKYKMLIYCTIAIAILGAFMGENPTRALLVYLISGLAAYIIAYRLKSRKIAKIYCVICVVAPMFIFIPLLISDSVASFFEQMQMYILGQTGNMDMASDTRTFLYLEMAEDLTRTDSWIWGKGAFAHYYSFYFDQDSLGRYGRMLSEVPILNYLLHGGIAYVVIYLSSLGYAIYNALWKGNNKFVTCCAVIIASWVFYSFVCDVTGCRFYHMVFYMLVGCCLSQKWLNYSDEDVNNLMR